MGEIPTFSRFFLLQTSLKPQCRFSQFSLYCFYLFFGDFPILNESITKFIYGSINFKMVFWGLHSPCMVYHSPWLVKKKTSQFKPLFKTEHTNRTRRQYLVIVKIVMLMLVESRFINRLDAGEPQLHNCIESTLTTYVARLHNDTNPWKCTPPLSQWSIAHHMPRLRSGPLLETAKNLYQRENTSHENPVSLRPRPGHDWVKKPDLWGQVGGNSPTAGILQQGRNCQRLQPRCRHLPLGVCRRHSSNLLSELSWENCKKFVVWAAWIVLVARSTLCSYQALLILIPQN